MITVLAAVLDVPVALLTNAIETTLTRRRHDNDAEPHRST
jgi:hypothetical protein